MGSRRPGLAPIGAAHASVTSMIEPVVAATAAFLIASLIGLLPSAGAMAMFSSLTSDRSNHVLLGRVGTAEDFGYVSLRRFEAPA